MTLNISFDNNPTIGITGANGYIGSRLSKYLEQAGYSVSHIGRYLPVNKSIKLIPFSLEKMDKAIPMVGLEALIHCAYDFSPTDYASSRRINLEGSISLFKKAKEQNIKQIIYISSTSAFEGARSNYGRIKYEIELYAKTLGVTIVRPGLVFSKNAGGIVGGMGNFLCKSPLVPVVGRGDQLFYTCHIIDLCALLDYILKHGIKITEPIVAANQTSISFKKILLMLIQFHHAKSVIIPVPYWFFFTVLKFGELIDVKTGLRSDSLKYMTCSNPNMDFSFINQNQLHFREFSISSLNDE
jgi:nucleoside-diphosphate-sugar epimerase